MFGIGSTELIVILVVALLVLGPRNLPKLAQTIGRAMGQFQRASKDFQRTINAEIALEEETEIRKKRDKLAEEEMAKKEAEKNIAAKEAVKSDEKTV